MESDPIVHSPDLSITTRQGVVTLEGDVPDEFARLRALDIVRQTPGVVQVVDRLRTPPSFMPEGGPLLVPRAVRAALVSPRPEPEPAAQDGAVVPELVPARTGEIELADVPPASTEHDARPAEPAPEREASTSDVLAAQSPDLPTAAPALKFPAGMSEEDAAISVDVRAKVEEAVPSGRVQVATRHGVVTLSGVVDTELEKSQALEAARRVRGVARVEDRLFVLGS